MIEEKVSIENLLRRIDELEKEIAELREQNALKDTIITAQDLRIKELEEKLNKNSQNSSKPPSSDGFKKARPVSNREKTGRKPGAQAGHRGNGFKLPKPDKIEDVTHEPEKCQGCPYHGSCPEVGQSQVRNEIDVEITIVLRRHTVVSYACHKAGGVVLSGEFPEGINSSMQYGPGVKTLAATLNTEGMMSVQRTHDFLSAFLGLPISTGTISTMVQELARKVYSTVQAVFQALLHSAVNHGDETGFRAEGVLYWMHSVCNAVFTYLSVQKKRGEEGMRAIGFLPEYKGILVTDCFRAYWNFPQLSHAICNAHILRELKGIHENYPEQGWAEELWTLLREMDHCRNASMQAGEHQLPPQTVEESKRRYDDILDRAASANPIPPRKPGQRGRTPKGKVRSLIDRLRDHRNEALLFLTNYEVPFTNNLAEQSIRMAKVKGKVSGCLRTKTGADDFATIMSFIGSVKKHQVNVFQAVKKAFLGDAYSVLFPAL